MQRHKAIFLDRDGIINRDVGYACTQAEIEFMPDIFAFCRTAVSEGYALMIVTNQSAIGRGYISEEGFHTLMHWMQTVFKEEQCPLTAVYYCPHHPSAANTPYRQNCDCRKPQPGMLLKAAADWQIDLSRSIMLGDKESDMLAARQAGVGRYWLIGSPKVESVATYRYSNLKEAMKGLSNAWKCIS